jgi:hypothetical protein
MELMELLILVVGISIVLIISHSFLTSSEETNVQMVVEEKEFNRVMDEVIVFFYEKIPILDKSLAQVFGDYLRWGNSSYVFYGKYYGNLDVKEFVEDHFNSTFERNWHLEASYNKTSVEFGFKVPEKIRVRTFMIRLPIPKALTDGEVINVEFTQW